MTREEIEAIRERPYATIIKEEDTADIVALCELALRGLDADRDALRAENEKLKGCIEEMQDLAELEESNLGKIIAEAGALRAENERLRELVRDKLVEQAQELNMGYELERKPE